MEPSVVAPPPEPMSGTVSVVGAPSRLIEALAPLSKGSLARGTELAKELAGRVKEYLPQPRPWGIPAAVRKFSNFFDKAKPEPIDVSKLLSVDKVTGARPPARGITQLPEDFTLTRSGRPMIHQDLQNFKGARDPNVESARKVWDKYLHAVGKTANNRTVEGPPALSGRWNNRKLGSGGQIGNQANRLKSAYKKKP